MTRRLIVNADDWGLTRGVSEGILAAHRHGIVSSTTVLATAALDRELVARLRDSGLGLGIHVNLTLGAPLTRGRSLVDGDGRFVRDARRAAARASASDVRAEVEAQVQRFDRRSSGGRRTSTPITTSACTRGALGRLDVARALGVAVRSQDSDARARARTARLKTPDHFFGESGPDAYWSPDRTVRHLRELPAGVSEFMCHPGWFDADLAYSRYGRQREIEMIGLGTAPARATASALGITLAPFADL